jgi:hypothetical protein
MLVLFNFKTCSNMATLQFYGLRSYYEGMWANGERHGWGRMSFANGEFYEGGWCRGRRDGAGTLKCDNGDRFEGVWRDDVKEGPGENVFVFICIDFSNIILKQQFKVSDDSSHCHFRPALVHQNRPRSQRFLEQRRHG